MRKKLNYLMLLFILMFTLTAVFPTAVVYAANDADDTIGVPGEAKSKQNEILVTFAKGSDKAKKDKIMKDENLDSSEEISELNVKVIKLPPGKSLEDIKGLAKKYTEITSVEENYAAYTSAALVPDDPTFNTYMKNGYTKYRLPDVWGAVSSAPVTIAVLDTGVFTHTEFNGRLLKGYDFVNNIAGAVDDNGHGTRVAGFMAAQGNNGVAIAGVNWSAKILPVKVLGSSGTGYVSAIAKGIIYAADNGASIINLSLGTTSDSSTLKSAIDYAINKGCIIVAAAGNTGGGTLEYPAKYENVIAVGAYDGYSARTSYSNYGIGLDVLASGSGYTTTMSGAVGSCAGTSFSAPLISGILSIAKSVYPGLNNATAAELIKKSAVQTNGATGWVDQTGYGYIDYYNVYENALKMSGLPAVVPDTTAPVLTLTEPLELSLNVGDVYGEPGYKATDNIDGDITAKVVITNYLTTDNPGEYSLVYQIADNAGNKVSATRKVTVLEPIVEEVIPDEPIIDDIPAEGTPTEEPVPEETPQDPEAPVVNVIGSNPIILHINGTDYTEQGASAEDALDGDISEQIEISGDVVNTSAAGNYTVTYSVTNSSGIVGTANRTVKVLAPNEHIERLPYTLTGSAQKKEVGKIINHVGILAESDGVMDLKVTVSNGTIDLVFKNSSGKALFTETISSTSTRSITIPSGSYTVEVTNKKISGNLSYKVELIMPALITFTFAEEEVPWGTVKEIPKTGDSTELVAISTMLVAAIAAAELIRRRKTAR